VSARLESRTGAGRRTARPPLALAYHGVTRVRSGRAAQRLFVDSTTLRRHIGCLRRWGYEFVTFGEFAQRVAAGRAEGSVALTFDDGFVDNLHTLVPLLHDEGAIATVFVVASWDGDVHPEAAWTRALTRPEVVELSEAGLEIGAHGMRHRDLSELSYAGALADMSDARKLLEDLLGRSVDVLAYPLGHATVDTRRACRVAGYRAACRISGIGSWDDPWNLPRQDMEHGASAIGLWLKRHDIYEPVMRTAPARATRRLRREIRRVLHQDW
jgi:peptidoglycan/xylan/chitin deacetylase (PgdA/CDA1 family)